LAKGILSSGVQVLVLGVSKSGMENLKQIAWGLDVVHKDRTRINLLSLHLNFSEFYLVNFYFLQVVLFKKFINSIHPPHLVFVLLVYRSYTGERVVPEDKASTGFTVIMVEEMTEALAREDEGSPVI